MDQFADWAESLLAFHAFLKYGCNLFAGDQGTTNMMQYQKSFERLMGTMVSSFDRGSKTHGFKIQKMLECSHFGKDHVINGPPYSHNTDTGERGLKFWAKAMAQTAQKRGDEVFKAQVVQNVLEAKTLNRLVAAGECLFSPPAPPRSKQGYAFANKSHIYIQRVKDGRITESYITSKADLGSGAASPSDFPDVVLEWFRKTFKGHKHQNLTVQLATEMTLASGTDQEELLRAHPNYRQDGPWYDFVTVDYGQDYDNYPARCACFFEWPPGVSPGPGILGECREGDPMVLLQQSAYQDDDEVSKESLLYSHYHLEHQANLDRSQTNIRRRAKLACVSAATVNGRVFAIDPNPTNGGVFWKGPGRDKNKNPPLFSIILVKDRKSQWPESFLRGKMMTPL
jgi:hypothetical protein